MKETQNAFLTSGTSPTFEPLLDDEQVGTLLGLHPKTVQRFARDGKLPAIRIGKFWRYKASMLSSWIDEQQTGSSDHVVASCRQLALRG